MPLLLAAAISAGVAWVAWLAGTLTRSGLAAAWSVGTAVLYGCGWPGGAVLAAFFVSSNLVGAKSERRDHRQVFANGGPAALAALFGRSDLSLSLWLVTASLAAAAADTWATSIGTRPGMKPRLLLWGPAVVRGANGGMTLAGTAAALVGAALVSGTAALAQQQLIVWPAGILVGFAGMLLDSILGATLQGRHRWINNDTVNFLATSLALVAALLLWRWLD